MQERVVLASVEAVAVIMAIGPGVCACVCVRARVRTCVHVSVCVHACVHAENHLRVLEFMMLTIRVPMVPPYMLYQNRR